MNEKRSGFIWVASPSKAMLFIVFVFLTQVMGADIADCRGFNCDLVVGGGSPAVQGMIGQWSLFFGMKRPHIRVRFSPIGLDALDYLTKPCLETDDDCRTDNHGFSYDYAVYDHDPTDDIQPELRKSLTTAPIFSLGIVLAHRVTGFSSSNPLYLSRELIGLIFSFQILRWNDTRIVNFNRAINPGAILPNTTIKVVLRTDPSGLTRTMNKFMMSVNSSWPSNASLYWPYSGVNNTLHAKSSYASTNAVLTRSNSIGYVPMSYAISAGLPYVVIQNSYGNFIAPSSHSLQAALDDQLTLGLPDAADAPGPSSYPLTLTAYVIMIKNAQTDCKIRAEMHKFWHWCLTDKVAIAHAEAEPGFALLPSSVTDFSLERLRLDTCNGVSSLLVTYAEADDTPLRLVMETVSSILILATVALFNVLLWKRDHAMIKATGMVFIGTFLLGCFFNYMSVIVWALIPDTSRVCHTRMALVIVGCSLCIIAIFTKTWSVFNFLRQKSSAAISSFEEIPGQQLSVYIFMLVAFQMLLLGLWMGTNETHSAIKTVDSLDLAAIHYCTQDSLMWITIEAVFLGVFVAWSIYLSRITRAFWAKLPYPNESQAFLSATLNAIFWTAILLPTLTVISGSPETTYFLQAIALMFSTTFALISIFMPKFFHIFDAIGKDKFSTLFTVSGREVPIMSAAGYRPPASSAADMDASGRNFPEVYPENTQAGTSPILYSTPSLSSIQSQIMLNTPVLAGRSIRVNELPTCLETEEKESKRDSPMIWYRREDPNVAATGVESGRNSPTAEYFPPIAIDEVGNNIKIPISKSFPSTDITAMPGNVGGGELDRRRPLKAPSKSMELVIPHSEGGGGLELGRRSSPKRVTASMELMRIPITEE